MMLQTTASCKRECWRCDPVTCGLLLYTGPPNMAASRDDDGSSGQEAGGSSMEEGRSPREDTPPAPCAAFCGPRACSTLPPNISTQQPQPVTEPKRRRLWGLRGLVKMFRRRVRRRAGESVSPQPSHAALRARSTSELAVDIQHRSSGGPYNQGLSVSHDSVFTPDAAADGHHSHSTPPALAIATRGVNMAELKAALRRRRGDDSGSGDDDPGLPLSPPTSPTTLDVLNHGLKSCSRATQSTCSDGSLLSMGSSENDEDSFGAVSHHSSKGSLLEGRHQVVAPRPPPSEYPRRMDRKSFVSDAVIDGRLTGVLCGDEDHEPVAGAAPLSHQAAFHKISVRPKRTHGAPRTRRSTQIGGQRSLPTTPEVNEDASTKSGTPSKVPTSASPSTPTELPSHSAYDEESSPSLEQHVSIERRESEKKDKEDKKDEPLLQRLFGSVRSGRRRSRGSGDDSRENSVSPLRRGGDQRASREKRRDSSGSRFSMLGRASTKAHNDSHPLPPSGRARDPSRERPYKEASSSPPQTPRSSSVEGRLESTGPGQQSAFHISSYDDRPSRPFNGVRKVKSFREVAGQPETQREPIHRKVSSQSNVEERISISSKISRMSASFESLDNESDSKLTHTANSSGTSSTEILSTSPQRSSTDSLTSTQIPGVFIRQHSQNQHRIGIHKHQDQFHQSHYLQQGNQDSGSGPLSLDSSISLHTRESDEHMRKASSVDHVSYVIGSWQSAKDSEVPDPVVHKATESKQALVSKNISAEIKPADRVSPKQTVRSHSLQGDDAGPPVSGTDESEAEGERTPRRPLKKEPSMKRVPPRDVEPDPVPEFMRIQLNRVESKGQSVVFETEQEKGIKTEGNDKELHKSQAEPSAKETSMSELSDGAVVYRSESKDGKSSSLNKRGSAQFGKGPLRDVSPSSGNVEIVDSDSNLEGSTPDSTVERVVLRKPLVSERAPLIERASSMSSQGTSSKNEQPELFKVFARRSFKVKDVEKEKSQESDNEEEENIEVASEVSEVMVIPTRAPVASSVSPVPSKETPLPATSISLTAGQQKPSLNAISFNRKSVGNPALSFCPPPITNTSATAPGSPKATVLVVSGNTSPLPVSTDLANNAINTSRNISTITTTSSTMISSASRSITTITTPNNALIINKPTTAPIHGPTVRTSNATPTSEAGVTVTTSSSSVFSKIISRSSSITAPNDVSRNDQESAPATPPPPKLSVSGRSGSSIVWPPRPQPQEETQPAVHLSHTSHTSVSGPQPKKVTRSPSSVSESEDTKPAEVPESKEGPVEISPLDIGAARRRFMSGGKDRPQAPATPPSQNANLTSASPVPSSPGTASLMSKPSSAPVTETRNAAPSFTVTVRTQSPGSVSHTDSQATTTPVTSTLPDSNVNTSVSASTGKSEHGVAQQAAEDWRVLVRQRREGRLKQSKTPDTEEIIIETRPPVSRNSKVLEMANNFQKLQVA
ncbi:flocculation protein FLO11-like isoform X2 [Penaeus japonicus]|uniref:flocculation protein FLO11-like isoform X2 n=1 Tax=Penaeus japonicus TaxID=27405 RepID=UPI001C716EF9|nr:flocculation protein FLO11-like isoform X2 [Penaeus japonicus]